MDFSVTRGFGARIDPGADLGMAVGEVQGAGIAVVTGGDIVEHLAGGVVAVANHIHDEEAVVEALDALGLGFGPAERGAAASRRGCR